MRTITNNKDRGPLIKVQIGPHRYAKMYEKDAIKQGLLPRTGKLPNDRGEVSKSPSPLTPLPDGEGNQIVPREEWEDFTEIPGIGEASCSALYDNGVHTWDDLLDADVSFLNPRARAAVAAWRETITPNPSSTIGEGSDKA